MAATLELAAPAKLNLYLHITGKRPDGYHLLDSLVAFVDIQDTLRVTPAAALAFSADGPFALSLGDGDSNLVVKAALGLSAAAGRDAGVALHLTKRLPVASGIGGGSADAAACLRGLAHLWGLDPGGDIVRRVAERLGSDIPVCVTGKAAFMGGIGTELAAAPQLPSGGIVLVNPGIALPTPDVYRARTGEFSMPLRFSEAPPTARALAGTLTLRRNDLTEAAMSLAPEIGTVLAALQASPGCLLSRMSGSGATCFGLYDDRAAAESAVGAIRERHPRWWIEAGQLIDRADRWTARYSLTPSLARGRTDP